MKLPQPESLELLAGFFDGARFRNPLTESKEFDKAAWLITDFPGTRTWGVLHQKKRYAVFRTLARGGRLFMAYHDGPVEICRIGDLFTLARFGMSAMNYTYNFSPQRAQLDTEANPRLATLVKEVLAEIEVVLARKD